MLILSIILLAVFSMAAFADLRRGMALTVVMAFLQDPLRKMTDGQPQIFILFAGVVFAFAAIGSATRGGAVTPFSIPAWRKYLTSLTLAFIVIILFQAANSFIRFGSFGLLALGLLNYLAPLLALTTAYQFAAREGIDGLRWLLRIYVALAFVASLTIALEAMDFDWKILGSVGPGVWITTTGGLNSLSGTFRASEIAAWHIAMASAVTILLLTSDRTKLFSPTLAGLIVCIFIMLGVLTGRRKFIIIIGLFALTFVLLQALFIRRARVSSLVLVIAVVASLAALFLSNNWETSDTLAPSSEYFRYMVRTRTVFGDIGDRVEGIGLAPLFWAFDGFGFFGAGLGVGTQGANAFLADMNIAGAAEGGLGKLMLELGVPGLVIVGLMAIATLRMIKAILIATSFHSPRIGRYAAGFAAILVAQVAHFSVATQAFGDIFVLILDGVVFGALLACPVLANRERQRQVSMASARSAMSMPKVGRLIPG